MTDFDPAAEFYLTMPWHNLFEKASALPTAIHYRCKGCREIIPMSEREKHYNRHRGALTRSETARQERVRRERVERLANARERKVA